MPEQVSTRSAAATSGPALVPQGPHLGKPPIPISRMVMLVGARSNAHLHLLSRSVSKAHALIVNAEGQIYIRDLASRTGVIVNDQPVREADLKHGDIIRIGGFVFRFIHRANRNPAPPPPPKPFALQVSGETMPLKIQERVALIGRRSSADVPLVEATVSTAHAVIFLAGEQHYLRDLGSRNGTFLNGQSVHQSPISVGDVIRVGETDIRYVPATVLDEDDELENLVGTAPLLEPEADVLPEPELVAPAAMIPLALASTPAVEEPPAAEPPPVAEEAAIPLVREEPAAPSAEEPEEPEEPLAVEEPPTAAEVVEEPPAVEESPAAEVVEEAPVAEGTPAIEEPPAAEVVDEPPVVEEPVPAEPTADEVAQAMALADEISRFLEEPSPVEAAVEETPAVEEPPAVEETPVAEPTAVEEREEIVVAPEVAEEAPVAETKAIAETPAVEETTVEEEVSPIVEPAAVVEEPLPEEPVAAPEAVEVEPPAEETAGEPPLIVADTLGVQAVEVAEAADARPTLPPPEPVLEEAVDETPPPVETAPPAEPPSADSHVVAEQPAQETPPTDVPLAEIIPVKPKRQRKPRKPRKPRIPPPIEVAGVGADEASEPPAAEILERTEPTPQSAQALGQTEDELLQVEDTAGLVVADESPAEALSDTRFDAQVQEFTGAQTGPLVEETVEAEAPAAPQPVSEESVPPVSPPADFQPPSPPTPVDEDIGGTEQATPEPEPEEDFLLTPPEDGDVVPHQFTMGLLGGVMEIGGGLAPILNLEEPAAPPADTIEEEDADEASAPPAAPVDESPAPPEPPKAEEPQVEETFDSLLGLNANTTGFLGGLPLRLDELPPPPENFGRVQISFGDRPATAPAVTPVHQAPLDLSALDVRTDAEEQAEANRLRAAAMKPPPPARFVSARTADVVPPAASPFEFDSEQAAALQSQAVPMLEAPPGDGISPASAFDGLAMAPTVAQTDVFSQIGPATLPPVGVDLNQAPAEAPIIPEYKKPGGADASAALTGWIGALAGADSERDWGGLAQRADHTTRVPPAMEADAPLPVFFRSRLRSVPALLVMMLLCMGIAAATIYGLIKPHVLIEGRMGFNNAKALTQPELRELKLDQMRMVEREETRRQAAEAFRVAHPNVAGGFLDDTITYSRVVGPNVEWAGGDGGLQLIFRYHGTDPEIDHWRVEALTSVLYALNGERLRLHQSAQNEIEDFRKAVAEGEKKVRELREEIERLGLQQERRPSRAELDELEREVGRLEGARRQGDAAVERLRQELRQIQEALEKQPAALDVQNDAKLNNLLAERRGLSERVNVLRGTQSISADAARKSLDAALEQFQAQVAAMQELMRDNPRLREYVSTAQELRELTGRMIQHQQSLHDLLSEMRRKLEDSMDARRREAWENDPVLKGLRDEHAVALRLYNAGLSGGKDAAEQTRQQKTRADELSRKIESRKRELGNDKFYADAVNQLQGIIDFNQRQLRESRKESEQKLADLQKNFSAMQPLVEKLPAAQKAAAAGLDQRLAALNTARQAYAQAVDAQTGQARQDLASLETHAGEIERQIEARRTELAQANERVAGQRQALLAQLQQKQAELEKQLQGQRDLDGQLAAARKKAEEHKALAAAASASGNHRDELIREADTEQKMLISVRTLLENAIKRAGRTVYPTEPRVSIASPLENKAPTYALVSVLAIGAVFTLLIFLTARQAHAAVPLPAPAEDAPPTEAEKTEPVAAEK